MTGSRVPIRALLVDYGEVLSLAPDPTAFADMAGVVGVEPMRFTDAYWALRSPYDRGELDGPAYWALVGQTISTSVDSTMVTELVERDIALWSRVDERMVAWANAMAASGVRMGVLSNMVAEIGAHLRDTLGLFASFASVTYSYEVRAAKPDRRIYEHALGSLGARPEESLLIDDRLPNVDAARELGMHAHHFRGRDPLVAELDERYALLS